jgi:F-type H+/Na+-transporting ATPase subunit beta
VSITSVLQTASSRSCSAIRIYRTSSQSLGIDELSEDDRVLVGRARRIQRFLSQNTFVAKVFTGIDGSFVPLSETITAFEALADGKYDHLPEQAFFMCGGLDDVERRAAELAKS